MNKKIFIILCIIITASFDSMAILSGSRSQSTFSKVMDTVSIGFVVFGITMVLTYVGRWIYDFIKDQKRKV